jgi:hypothetical protein
VSPRSRGDGPKARSSRMPRYQPRLLLQVATLLLVCTLIGCATKTRATQKQAQDAATPEATVAAYYHALGQHLFTKADAYLAPATRSLTNSYSDSPATNLASLERLNIDNARVVTAAFLPGLPSGISTSDYDSFSQVTVEYDATFRRVISEQNGRLTRFLYLGQLRLGAQWQILSIGSGP